MAITVENKSHSATKRGPGRVHAQGCAKASPPKQRGAGIGFEQHTNPLKNKVRAFKAQCAYDKRRKGLPAPTEPDFSALRAQEAKAARGRAARAKRAMGL